MKQPIQLDSIKILPQYFTDLDNIKKINTREVYDLYAKIRQTTDENKIKEIQNKIDLITKENIFLWDSGTLLLRYK